MSELRALTKALRSLHTRLTSFGECLVVLVRNSAQASDWRHEQQNLAQQAVLREALRDRAFEQLGKSLKQAEEFQGALWKYLERLDERQAAEAKTRHDDLKEVKDRLRVLESDHPPGADEVTQA